MKNLDLFRDPAPPAAPPLVFEPEAVSKPAPPPVPDDIQACLLLGERGAIADAIAVTLGESVLNVYKRDDWCRAIESLRLGIQSGQSKKWDAACRAEMAKR